MIRMLYQNSFKNNNSIYNNNNKRLFSNHSKNKWAIYIMLILNAKLMSRLITKKSI